MLHSRLLTYVDEVAPATGSNPGRPASPSHVAANRPITGRFWALETQLGTPRCSSVCAEKKLNPHVQLRGPGSGQIRQNPEGSELTPRAKPKIEERKGLRRPGENFTPG